MKTLSELNILALPRSTEALKKKNEIE